MSLNRRDFLRAAGFATLGLAGVSFASEKQTSGKRWAMAVDIKKCKASEGCTECSTACHYVHNVPEIQEKRHEVKWIWTESYGRVFDNHENPYVNEKLKALSIPVLCNHCENPSCVRVCPTKATFKRKDGIVAMDFHRCIGCRYCMAACPYGSRSFNWFDPRGVDTNGKPFIREVYGKFPTRTKGVVEKCNFCIERLVRGNDPACVEKCPNGALVFGDVNDPGSDIRKALANSHATRRTPELGTDPQVYYVV
ncbi:sulfate reduction electron transfer complex DsrMKJOP subunit DsrO [Candidatus Hydrogenedentota bacterium]